MIDHCRAGPSHLRLVQPMRIVIAASNANQPAVAKGVKVSQVKR